MQLFHVSKQIFSPLAFSGIPRPSPVTNPTGGTSRKQKAIPSAPSPSYILKSNSAFQRLQTARLMGCLKNAAPLDWLTEQSISSELSVPVTLVTKAPPCRFQPAVFIGEPDNFAKT